ncbi:unnamed protein product [Musa acuminata subsp. malaccensis]|uniref:(wild Malaysian banana) hypothetical protein n=1 Tax=Musa acuminata subsp. malaccensis TaxID=214687 RepID=A0A8D7B1V3_MUSAM|nr:unnamed protein product [Musa acuminata subsp. malaccensis]
MDHRAVLFIALVFVAASHAGAQSPAAAPTKPVTPAPTAAPIKPATPAPAAAPTKPTPPLHSSGCHPSQSPRRRCPHHCPACPRPHDTSAGTRASEFSAYPSADIVVTGAGTSCSGPGRCSAEANGCARASAEQEQEEEAKDDEEEEA